MRKKPIPVRNDGWKDIAYDFGPDADQNARLSKIINDACHVFRHHAEGRWRSHDKDAYATALSVEIAARPGLVRRLLDTQDRVVQSLTYRALELLKEEAAR